ncbi:MAG TPA: JAB domain-containing protein, partial [Flavisolibacter sp.]|nr:JAB domain-containing protein [Flavisolibacter sp.]
MKKVKYKVSEINVSYRPRRDLDLSPVITDSSDAATYLLEGFNKNTMAIQEQFVVMYLNTCNKIIGLYRASIGGMTGTVADPRLI